MRDYDLDLRFQRVRERQELIVELVEEIDKIQRSIVHELADLERIYRSRDWDDAGLLQLVLRLRAQSPEVAAILETWPPDLLAKLDARASRGLFALLNLGVNDGDR